MRRGRGRVLAPGKVSTEGLLLKKDGLPGRRSGWRGRLERGGFFFFHSFFFRWRGRFVIKASVGDAGPSGEKGGACCSGVGFFYRMIFGIRP